MFFPCCTTRARARTKQQTAADLQPRPRADGKFSGMVGVGVKDKDWDFSTSGLVGITDGKRMPALRPAMDGARPISAATADVGEASRAVVDVAPDCPTGYRVLQLPTNELEEWQQLCQTRSRGTASKLMRALLERALPHLRSAGRRLDLDDLFVCAFGFEQAGAHSPLLRTDPTWALFPGCGGFQIWLMVEPSTNVPHGRGNLFLAPRANDALLPKVAADAAEEWTAVDAVGPAGRPGPMLRRSTGPSCHDEVDTTSPTASQPAATPSPHARSSATGGAASKWIDAHGMTLDYLDATAGELLIFSKSTRHMGDLRPAVEFPHRLPNRTVAIAHVAVRPDASQREVRVWTGHPLVAQQAGGLRRSTLEDQLAPASGEWPPSVRRLPYAAYDDWMFLFSDG